MAYDILVNQSDLRETEVAEAPPPDEDALADGEALFEVSRFALTANNVTYGAIGHMIGYWKFFPAEREGWGRVPAWGFADVVASKAAGVQAGERVYGFVPMSSHVVMRPGDTEGGTFVDAAPHRAELPPIYNRYIRTTADSAWSPALEPQIALFRPLFTTSFLLDDELAAHGFHGADRVVLTSASSKTALGLALLLHEDREVEVVGLTSPGNVGFVGETGYYDRVVPYDDLADLDAATPTVIVDFAGSAGLLGRLHRQVADAITFSQLVGVTNWESMGAPEGLPGPAPQWFFAPAVALDRVAAWGQAAFVARAGEALARFIASSDGWLEVAESSGPDAIRAVWGDLTEGAVDPAAGHVVAP